jgi:hypothetical protein
MAFYLIVYPSGFLGSRATMHFFESPPSFEEGLSTFVFLLISAIALLSYAVISLAVYFGNSGLNLLLHSLTSLQTQYYE